MAKVIADGDYIANLEELSQRILRIRGASQGARIRLSADERRRVIIEAAREVIRDIGEGRASLREVAARCSTRTSEATIIHHFKSMSNLIEAARSVAA